MDAADRGHEHGNHDRHTGCDPVANQARRQRRVNARQQDRRECHGGRPAGMIDQQGKQDIEGPRLVNPGGARSREGQRVGVWHGARREDVAAQAQVPERARIVEQRVPAADQCDEQDDHEDQLARSR